MLSKNLTALFVAISGFPTAVHAIRCAVFDGTHNYFANGMLVGNSHVNVAKGR